MDNKKLAEILFPNVKDCSFYVDKYKRRDLKDGEQITRFAPSPTGFLHIGGVFTTLINYLVAKKSGGKIFLRLEDTDQERKVEGSDKLIVKVLSDFGLEFDEGIALNGEQVGDYAPYIQSERMDIYKSFAKKLVENGLAYPCFCDEADEREIEEAQTLAKEEKRGYYGKYAKCRNLTYDEVVEKIGQGKSFAIRLRCQKKQGDRFKFKDKVKGEIEMDANINDTIILKSNGLPPYNFAHAVDDYLMGTTLVIRGEDWLSATSEHSQIFEALNFKAIPYAHLPQLETLDGNSRRKLSKRKDPEADASLFFKLGYPKEGIIDYLMTIINSDYEMWRANNRRECFLSFDFKLNKVSKSGSLFDMVKLTDVCKNTIAYMTTQEVYDATIKYLNEYDSDFAKIVESNKERLQSLLSIDRGGEKPRKDISKWSDVKEMCGYIFDDIFFNYTLDAFDFDFEKYSKEMIKEVATHYLTIYNESDDKQEWFNRIKSNIEAIGFASDMKAYKQNPQNYKGSVADYTTIIRVLLTGKKNTPDL
ncbi:MAG: glutamate--tRNA ligase, partial [Christensenellales bacterium]